MVLSYEPHRLPAAIDKQLILATQVFSKDLVPEEIELRETSLSKHPAEAQYDPCQQQTVAVHALVG